MKTYSRTIENGKLLSLIEQWAAADENIYNYKEVCEELLNGDTYLYFESNEEPAPIESFGENDPTLAMPYYNVEGEPYFCAFTSSNLFVEFAEAIPSDKPRICVKMPAKHLIEAVDNSPMAGLIINTHSENVFVRFREEEK